MVTYEDRIRKGALALCAKDHPDNPCTEPCAKCWQEVEQLLSGVLDKLRQRDEHLAWCRTRALEYLDAGDLNLAFASMMSDLGKHSDTTPSPGGVTTAERVRRGLNAIVAGDKEALRRWIEEFRGTEH